MKLRIADNLALPLDAVTQTFGILAVRGAGKSNTAAAMAEEMYRAKLPFVVVDPVGSWFGLRSSADGTGPGLEIPILGGKRGDVPLERGGGEVVADLVVDERLSAVLDLSEFDSEGAKKEFLLAFARRLYKRNEQPLHLFLEEADDYIPQRPMRDEAHLLRAFENIVRRGRARGIGITLITQRSASINKNVLTQVETLIVLRTTSPQDRKAIEEWVKYHDVSRELLESLSSLENGEAWIWSPHWLGLLERVRIRRRETFDSGATPKERAAKPAARLADVDLEALKGRMSATIERAKAEDPRELRKKAHELERKIQDLERQLKARPTEQVERVVKKTVEVPVLKGEQLEHALQLADKLLESVDKLTLSAAELKTEISRAVRQPASVRTTAVSKTAAPVRTAPAHPAPPREVRQGGSDDLTGPERKILNAIAWLESIGIDEPEQTAAAFLAGYTVGGGAWNNPRGSLRTKGLIAYRGNRLALTDEGRALATSPEQALTTEELHRSVMERLPGPEQKLLGVLIESYPDSVPNDELARRSGYEPGGGAFNNPRGRLRSLGLIEYPEKGLVVARPILFLEGA